MKILLSPHADDETLFAAYTLLREKPLVVLCFPGAPRHGAFEVRLAEFATAMAVLGCEWVSVADDPDSLEQVLRVFDIEHVYAPLPEIDGNDDHNHVGDLAAASWAENVTFYATYTHGAKTTLGQAVPYEQTWPALKRKALDCYQSQQAIPGIRAHFNRPLDEYLVPWSEVESVAA